MLWRVSCALAQISCIFITKTIWCHLSGTVAFTDPENVGLDTKIVILRDPEAKISLKIGFCVMAAFKIQDGRQAVLCESGSYQK